MAVGGKSIGLKEFSAIVVATLVTFIIYYTYPESSIPIGPMPCDN